MRNLSLIGFMGVGKSSVGQIIAGQLRFDFVDTDAWIEEMAGKPISAIFEQNGEEAFRAYEASVIQELSGRSGLVIATGGGMAANPDHMNSLKGHSLVVWLCASAETLWERVRFQTHRPLLQTADPLGKIRALLGERMGVYRQADVLVNTESRSVKEVAQHVITQFRAATAGRH
jgi:shikimate kinase